MTIFFVDEDYPKLYSWIVELEFRGHKVKPLGDADRALAALLAARDIDWVIIDVMLAAWEQGRSKYTEERTDQGLVTGLTLLEDLCTLRPGDFPAKAHLLTAATNKHPFVKAHQLAQKLGVELTLKSHVESPRDFGDIVERAMEVSRTRSEMVHEGGRGDGSD